MFDNQNNNNVQFENQQLGNGFYGDSGVESITGKKKGKKAAVIGGITAAALAGGCATAYAVSDTVKNQVKLRTMKPENYYAWVYENNSSTISKNISDNYAKQLEKYKGGIGVNYNLNYEMPDSVKSKLKESTGGDEDINSIIDNIKNISIDMNGSVKDGGIGYTIGANFNGDKLATIEYSMDPDNMDVYFRCPELTEKWLSVNTASLAEEVTYDEDSQKALELYKDFLKDPESILSPADLEKEINKYVSIWYDNTNEVKIEKKETITLGDITVDYTVAEVEVTPELAKKMSSKFAEELKNDEIIKNIVVDKMGVSESDYTSDLDDFVLDINESDPDSTVSFKTYIDPTGTIRGISLTDDDGHEAKAILGKEGDKVRGEFSSSEDFSATLTATEVSSKTYSGSIDMTSDGDTYSIDFDSIKVVDEVNGYAEGTVKINTPELDSFTLEFTSDGKSQNIAYDINVEGENYGRLVLSYSTTKGDSITIPDKNGAFVIDKDTVSTMEIEDYVSQDEVESFLSGIFSKIGMKDSDEASKTIAGYVFGGGSSSYNAYDWDDEDFDWDDDEFDWDESDFDWDESDFDWDDYEFDFDEDSLNIDIPELATNASA